LSIGEKIFRISTLIYGADGVDYSKSAQKKLAKISNDGFDNLPVCMAKTQYSLSDQAALIGKPCGFRITINDIILQAGAEFVVAIAGDIFRMPGLPAKPLAIKFDVDADGRIVGL